MSGKLVLFWGGALLWLILDFFMALEYNPDKDNRTNFITGMDAGYYLLTGVLPVALGAFGVWLLGRRSRRSEVQDVAAEKPERYVP